MIHTLLDYLMKSILEETSFLPQYLPNDSDKGVQLWLVQ